MSRHLLAWMVASPAVAAAVLLAHPGAGCGRPIRWVSLAGASGGLVGAVLAALGLGQGQSAASSSRSATRSCPRWASRCRWPRTAGASRWCSSPASSSSPGCWRAGRCSAGTRSSSSSSSPWSPASSASSSARTCSSSSSSTRSPSCRCTCSSASGGAATRCRRPARSAARGAASRWARREYAAMKLTLMLLVGSAAILVAIFGLWSRAGGRTFDLGQLARGALPALDADVGLPAALARLRHAGRRLPVPHLEPGRPRLGAHRGQHAARRRADEARRVRRDAGGHGARARGARWPGRRWWARWRW